MPAIPTIGIDEFTGRLERARQAMDQRGLGGLIVWGGRIVATHALKMEAMGFGDVTLVAMIGAYLGWQPCLMRHSFTAVMNTPSKTMNSH